MTYHSMSASGIAEGVRTGRFSATEVFESSLERIRAFEPGIHALLRVTEDRGRDAARSVDEAVKSGRDPGPLCGVPVVLKDNMTTRGIATTCASRILGDWKPPYDATVVQLLERAGAVVVGKANMDEFAMGSSTEFSAYGPTANPWDPERVPGGSSGGSAAAVSAGYAPLSLGSDTGGSIRQPASFCGIYGLKPTYGHVSRYGLVAFASSLDQIGVFARHASDLPLALSVIGAEDGKDMTSSRRKRPDYKAMAIPDDLRGKRVGLVSELAKAPVDADVRTVFDATVRECVRLGAEILEVSLPTVLEYGVPCYYILAPAEASSNLARFDGVRYGMSRGDDSLLERYLETRAAGFGAEVKRRILTGTYVLSSGYYDAYYLVAQKVRRRITEEFETAFDGLDAILLPTSPTPAFRQGAFTDDPIRMYMADIFTLPVNLAGLPGLSLNAGFSKEGLPVGMQFIGPKWGDLTLLEIASVLEKTFGPCRCAPVGEVTRS
jgi:aspartyl-tRNA(Asn)/glutamyl-tRNA(Gln) amidotransferase subunit A